MSARFSKLLVPIVVAVAWGCVPKDGAVESPSAEPTPAVESEEPAGPPPPAVKAGENVFKSAPLYVDPESQAAHQASRATGEEARLLNLIASQPQADWLGDWTGYVETAARLRLKASREKGAIRVMIAYNIPNRDCGQYSAGGVQGPKEYEKWIADLASGLGGGLSAIILEPDALGLLEDCLSKADQEERFSLIRNAVRTLRARPGTAVYIDAGNANWIDAAIMAERLDKAGVREANGFALNVSNYVETEKTIEYGKRISAALGGDIGFVVDTSRNGRGEAPGKAWCNPEGRGLGKAPTAETGDPLVHAFLWLKRPGESDGECNGGPKAGSWFQERALELARNAAL